MLDVDVSDLERFARQIEQIQRDFPREARRIMARAGNEVRKELVTFAKANVKKKTGTYFKGFKRGKVYEAHGTTVTRIYNRAPHVHLVENDSDITNRYKKARKPKVVLGQRRGQHIFGRGTGRVEPKFNDILAESVKKVFKKL